MNCLKCNESIDGTLALVSPIDAILSPVVVVCKCGYEHLVNARHPANIERGAEKLTGQEYGGFPRYTPESALTVALDSMLDALDTYGGENG